jgi:DivIVA domain-containing protein
MTPEDVVNKRFNPTKFREGYDQDEVDDFLDEVVVELRRIKQENDVLREQLVASESRVVELQSAPTAEPVGANPDAASHSLDPDSKDLDDTNNLLQLARRLHEEHVREGMEKRAALIAEGHATADRVVSDAEVSHRSHLQSLETERETLQRKVEELRTFEREYRGKMKTYIESHLHELEMANELPDGPGARTAAAAAAALEVDPIRQPESLAFSRPGEQPGFAPN